MSVETSPRPTSTGTGNENETEAVNNRDITDTEEAMEEGDTETIAEVVEATDFTAEANQANAGFNEDDDLGITEETAAAIDSMASVVSPVSVISLLLTASVSFLLPVPVVEVEISLKFFALSEYIILV